MTGEEWKALCLRMFPLLATLGAESSCDEPEECRCKYCRAYLLCEEIGETVWEAEHNGR